MKQTEPTEKGCPTYDAPRFQSFGQRLVLKGRRKEQHNFPTGSEELRETITLKEFFGLTNAWSLLYSYASSVASNSLNILGRFSGCS